MDAGVDKPALSEERSLALGHPKLVAPATTRTNTPNFPTPVEGSVSTQITRRNDASIPPFIRLSLSSIGQ